MKEDTIVHCAIETLEYTLCSNQVNISGFRHELANLMYNKAEIRLSKSQIMK